MKKYITLLMSMVVAMVAFAQTPNRLLLHDTAGNYQGYVLNRVDSISFANVPGEVKAEINIKKVALDTLWMSVKRTPECRAFKIDVIPGSVAKQLTNPLYAISYMNRQTDDMYYDDFTSAELTGIALKPSSDYAVLTVGYDKYGVASDVCIAEFSTPAPVIAGTPKVTMEVVETKHKSFKVKFTPNDDVLCYYTLAGEKGKLMEQYEQFGAWMGFTSVNDMIISWGQVAHEGIEEVEWKDMAPNTEYDIYVCCLDANETPAPHQEFTVSTLALGGDGEAKVDITLGDYKMTLWDDELKPSQFVTFTPNDQSSAYRFSVYLASQYDSNKEAIVQELQSEPPMPMAYWFFYDPITTDFQINPNTECVAIASGKNAKGEWGGVTEYRFTTPASAQGQKAPAQKTAKIGTRVPTSKGAVITPMTIAPAKREVELKKAM